MLNEHDLLGHPVSSQPTRYKGAFGLPSAMASIFFSRTMILSSQRVSKTFNLIQNASLRSASRFKMMRRTTALISCQRLSRTMKSQSLSQWPKMERPAKDGQSGSSASRPVHHHPRGCADCPRWSTQAFQPDVCSGTEHCSAVVCSNTIQGSYSV